MPLGEITVKSRLLLPTGGEMTSLKQQFLIMTRSSFSHGHCGNNYVWARVSPSPRGSRISASQSLSMGFPQGHTDTQNISGSDGPFWDLFWICIDFSEGCELVEEGGWLRERESASICSSDTAYFRNSISVVWLRADSIDEGKAMMRPCTMG